MTNEKWRMKNEKLWWGRKAIPSVVARIFLGDSTSPLTREARMWCRAKGLLSFYNDCGNGDVRCNGRSELAPLRKASGIVQMQNHTSTHMIALRKASGIVRFWKGWWRANCSRDWDCLEVLEIVLLLISIPTVLTADRLSNYKSRIYPIKTLYNLGLCLAVKPPPLFRGEARVMAISYILWNRQSVYKASVVVRSVG